MTKKHYKVLFEVNYHKDEIIKETLWAFDLGNNEYCIDSIPFYIYSVAVGDIFSVKKENGFLYASDLIKASGNSTIRILFEDHSIVQTTREILEKKYACHSELSNLPNLVSVNIPFDTDYKILRKFLQEGEDSKKWEYQEACLSAQHC